MGRSRNRGLQRVLDAGSAVVAMVVGSIVPCAVHAEGAPSAGGQVPVVEQPAGTEQTRAEGRGVQYGAHLVVPVPLHGVFTDDFGAGFGIHGRVGWELPGGLSLEANLGYVFLSVRDYDLGHVDDDDGFNVLYGGFGGRFAFLNPSAMVPFVGAGLGLNLFFVGTETGFRGRSGQTYCGSDFSCTLAGMEGAGTFGGIGLTVNASAGVIYEVTARAAIEAGAQYNVLVVASPFDDARQPNGGYLTIFAGATLYY